jgi:hypothetical protein
VSTQSDNTSLTTFQNRHETEDVNIFPVAINDSDATLKVIKRQLDLLRLPLQMILAKRMLMKRHNQENIVGL